MVFMMVELRQYYASDGVSLLVLTESHHLAIFRWRYLNSSVMFPSGQIMMPSASLALDGESLGTGAG